MSGLFCIPRSDARKRDAGYEEREEQVRVNEMRDTKSKLEDKRFDKQ